MAFSRRKRDKKLPSAPGSSVFKICNPVKKKQAVVNGELNERPKHDDDQLHTETILKQDRGYEEKAVGRNRKTES